MIDFGVKSTNDSSTLGMVAQYQDSEASVSDAVDAVLLAGVSKKISNGSTEQVIIADVNLRIVAGEFLAILGVSGSGKTTLLNIIGAMDTATSGRVEIFGNDLVRMNERERGCFRRDSLGFVFQFYNLLPTLTAAENVNIGLELLKLPRREMEQRTAHYLEAVGLADKRHRFPSQLSGGEQQRVAIARALAKSPRLVLADEPTGNLDRNSGRSILNLMRELNQKSGTTFIIVTHDEGVTSVTDRVFRMDEQVAPTDPPPLSHKSLRHE